MKDARESREDEQRRREAAHSQPAEVLPGGHEIEPRSFKHRMDDPTEWEDKPLPRRSEKRQRAAMISVRLNLQELELIETAARWRGMTMSAYIRDRALDGAHINYKIMST